MLAGAHVTSETALLKLAVTRSSKLPCASGHMCICFVWAQVRFEGIGNLAECIPCQWLLSWFICEKIYITCQMAFWVHSLSHMGSRALGGRYRALLLFSVVGRWSILESGGLSSFIDPQMAEPGLEATHRHLSAMWQELGPLL